MEYKRNVYVSKPVDANGMVHYEDEENAIWQTLVARQWQIVKGRACEEYLSGLALLQLPHDRIPQCSEVSAVLQATTGFSLAPVPALIPVERFFYLLTQRQFPCATFIRRREDLNYLEEPDLFHELFGHCPLLTNQAYADFSQHYGEIALRATPEALAMLERLYWFTIEFGLVKSATGELRVYGGGILSSMEETRYALESDKPQRKPFEVLEVLRTPYRIDIMQPVYYVLESFTTLYHLLEMDLLSLSQKACELGSYPPLFPNKEQV